MTQTASLDLRYACDTAVTESRAALVLEQSGSFRQGKSSAIDIYLLFPPVSADLWPSVGSATLGAETSDIPVVENVKFNNSTRQTIKYPLQWYGGVLGGSKDPDTTGCPSPTSVGGFSANTVQIQVLQATDANGNPVSPPVSYNADTGELVSEIAISGIVSASYTARSRLVKVFRGADQIGVSGNIIAMYQGQSAEASFGSVAPAESMQVYSVVSEYVADENGAWEVPPDWPEENTYPDSTPDPLPNQDSYQQLERVHEICWLDYSGELHYESYTIKYEQPYEDAQGTYEPVYTFDQTSAPADDSAWSDAWSEIDWDSIYADVQQRYSGIEGIE